MFEFYYFFKYIDGSYSFKSLSAFCNSKCVSKFTKICMYIVKQVTFNTKKLQCHSNLFLTITPFNWTSVHRNNFKPSNTWTSVIPGMQRKHWEMCCKSPYFGSSWQDPIGYINWNNKQIIHTHGYNFPKNNRPYLSIDREYSEAGLAVTTYSR